MTLKDKVAIVTGGANGIGNSIAESLISQGCKVYILDIDTQSGRINPKSVFIKTDVSKEDNIRNAFQFIKSKETKVDILINNAGISSFKPLLDLSVKEWDEIINTNLRSAFICSQEFAIQHKKDSYGRIINIASTRHLMSELNSEAYAASKGGLVSLTHALALSMQGKGMTVNCISPGWIHTGNPYTLSNKDHEQHPSKRVGSPDDIANMVLFLCNEANDFITGQNFYIDGGMTKKMIYEE